MSTAADTPTQEAAPAGGPADADAIVGNPPFGAPRTGACGADAPVNHLNG